MTIIAATDYSAIAQNAVSYAAFLAEALGAKLVLFNAFKLSIHAANAQVSAETFETLLNENKKKLQSLAEKIALEHGIAVDSGTAFAYIGDELSVLIEKYQAELVVLGMAERSLEQDILGNTTTAVIKKIAVPILAVPYKAKFTGLKKVLFACDLIHTQPKNTLRGVESWLSACNAGIEVFSVDERIGELKAEGKELISGDNAQDEHQGITYSYKNVKSNAVISEIKNELMESGAELLIMVPQHYGFWSSLVHRSKTRMMASGLSVPLLSVPNT